MEEVRVSAKFGSEFKGKVITERSEIAIGRDENESSPYFLLLGAIAGCMQATLLEIIKKKKVEIKSSDIEVYGRKRDEIPTWLEYIEMNFKISLVDESKQKAVLDSMELAKKYCSVYNTLAQVAKIDVNVVFE